LGRPPALNPFKQMTPILKSNGSLAMATGLAQQGIALLQFILTARILAPADLGQWAMYLTLIGLADMARHGMVHNSMVHFTAGNQPDSAGARAAMLLWGLGLTAVAALLLAVPGRLLSDLWQMPALPTLFGIYLFTGLVWALVRHAESAGMAEEDFRIPLVTAVLYGTVLLMATAWYWAAGIRPGLQVLAWWQGAGWLTALGYVCWKRSRYFAIQHLSAHWLYKVWGFGRYSMMSNLSSVIMQRVDLFMLGFYVGSAELATYNVATKAITFLDFPLNALGQVAFPRLSATFHRQGLVATARLYEHSVGRLLAITLPLTLIVAAGAPMIVGLIGGAGYARAAGVLQLLALAGLIKPWGRMFGVTLDAIGRSDLNLKMLVLSFVLNIGFNVLLTPIYGIFGAALAAVLSILAGILTGQAVLRRLLPANPMEAVAHFWIYYKQLWMKYAAV
ncbi:MAG: lipopolysaccharide biosynthesis protein, partial [Saprospiraceae bacterium]